MHVAGGHCDQQITEKRAMLIRAAQAHLKVGNDAAASRKPLLEILVRRTQLDRVQALVSVMCVCVYYGYR